MSEILVSCRYNKNHKVKKSKLFIHECKCSDKNNSNVVSCPFNSNHKINIKNLEKHKKICENKPKINSEFDNKLNMFLNGKNNKINIKEKEENSKNDDINFDISKEEDDKIYEVNDNNNIIDKNEKIIKNFDDMTNQEVLNNMDNGMIDMEENDDENFINNIINIQNNYNNNNNYVLENLIDFDED
jgi:hypothetical protein